MTSGVGMGGEGTRVTCGRAGLVGEAAPGLGPLAYLSGMFGRKRAPSRGTLPDGGTPHLLVNHPNIRRQSCRLSGALGFDSVRRLCSREGRYNKKSASLNVRQRKKFDGCTETPTVLERRAI
jgi:hypothetical protein